MDPLMGGGCQACIIVGSRRSGWRFSGFEANNDTSGLDRRIPSLLRSSGALLLIREISKQPLIRDEFAVSTADSNEDAKLVSGAAVDVGNRNRLDDEVTESSSSSSSSLSPRRKTASIRRECSFSGVLSKLTRELLKKSNDDDTSVVISIAAAASLSLMHVDEESAGPVDELLGNNDDDVSLVVRTSFSHCSSKG